MVSSVDHVNTPDPYTVEICFNVLSNYGVCLIGDLPIVPKHIWENVPPDESVDYDPEEHDALIGTGPFRFFKDGVVSRVDRVPGESMHLESNPNCFRRLVRPDFFTAGRPIPYHNGRID